MNLPNNTLEALFTAQEALELIATPKRPDGTYNRDRASCELLAQEALKKIEEILYRAESKNENRKILKMIQ